MWKSKTYFTFNRTKREIEGYTKYTKWVRNSQYVIFRMIIRTHIYVFLRRESAPTVALFQKPIWTNYVSLLSQIL